jgi:hypothetical protein
MAKFCTKCGAPLAEEMRFCTACGATSDVPSAPVARGSATFSPQPMAAALPSGPGTPAAPAPTTGSPVLKIILIVVAVLIFLGLVSAGACVFMVYRARQRVRQFERQVHSSFPSPAGTPGVQTQPGRPGQGGGGVIDLGVPIYPGATPAEGGSSMSLGAGAVKVQQYTTSDSTDQVTNFYKDKLGSAARVMQRGQESLVQLIGSNGVVNVSIAPDDNTKKTRITISSIGK